MGDCGTPDVLPRPLPPDPFSSSLPCISYFSIVVNDQGSLCRGKGLFGLMGLACHSREAQQQGKAQQLEQQAESSGLKQ